MASESLRRGDVLDALDSIALAYDGMVSDYELRKVDRRDAGCDQSARRRLGFPQVLKVQAPDAYGSSHARRRATGLPAPE